MHRQSNGVSLFTLTGHFTTAASETCKSRERRTDQTFNHGQFECTNRKTAVMKTDDTVKEVGMLPVIDMTHLLISLVKMYQL